jgi:hypothetical protein
MLATTAPRSVFSFVPPSSCRRKMMRALSNAAAVAPTDIQNVTCCVGWSPNGTRNVSAPVPFTDPAITIGVVPGTRRFCASTATVFVPVIGYWMLVRVVDPNATAWMLAAWIVPGVAKSRTATDASGSAGSTTPPAGAVRPRCVRAAAVVAPRRSPSTITFRTPARPIVPRYARLNLASP